MQTALFDVPVNPGRRTRKSFVDDSQFGLFSLFPDEVAPLPTSENPVQEDNDAILAINDAVNYRITSADRLGQGSLRTKARDNVRAIRTVKQIQQEERHATPEEQAILVRFVGWGGIPQVFADDPGDWKDIQDEIRALLTKDEYAQAAESVLNAHYTSESAVRAIYDVLRQLGFSGGNVLEPAAGIGHFIGLMPDDLADNSDITAIELDPTSAAIAQALYPNTTVLASGFETAVLSNDVYDLAVGNVPFGSYPVHDPVYNVRRWSIHNYFFARALAAVRPGGVIAFLTSHYTLDQADTSVREALAAQADLVGAFRLPENAFKENANTEVIADLIILRKRSAEETPRETAWIDTVQQPTDAGYVRINEYFAEHPDMVLGTLGMRTSQHGPTLSVRPKGDLRPSILKAAVHLDRTGLFEHTERAPKPVACVSSAEHFAGVKDGAFLLLDGTLCRREGNSIVTHGLKNEKDIRRVTQLTRIRDAVREVLRTQDEEEPETDQITARNHLNYLYDRFVGEFKAINFETRTTDRRGRVSVRRPNLTSFRVDPDAMLVAGLEKYDAQENTATKAEIFSQRVVRPRIEISSCDSVQDAFLVTLDQKGRLDLAHLAHLWGDRTVEQVIEALGDTLYLNPETGFYETADAYLSEYVRKKLVAAKAAAETDASFERNVRALEAVQPEDLKPSEIYATLGSSWVPKADIVQFIRDLFGAVADKSNIEISFIEKDALWRVTAYGLIHTVEATRTWGTGRANAIRIIEDSLNQRLVTIYDTIEDENGREKSVRNVKETLDAQEKQQAVEERFAQWIWSNTERAERLLHDYNFNFNGIRLRTFDGSHLTLPNASSAITLDPHQKNAVWRILQTGNTLVAHAVGAGKTYVTVAAAMESKRLGLQAKPMIVVPNHMLEQFSREAQQLYPCAHILCASTEDFTGDGRRRFMARVATSLFDLIIITHDAFKKIPVDPKFEQEFIEGEIDQYSDMISEAEDDGDRLTVKQLQQARKAYEARLKTLINRTAKDTVLTFSELGVDGIYVDEAHKFKNLDTPTKIQGIPRASRPSQRAQDLLMKCLFLETINPGRGVVFLTGTPISNTIAELYVMLRYLARHLLENIHCAHFDAWAATFTKRVHALELSPDGSTYRVRARFLFENVPELVSMYRIVADIQTAEMLRLPRPELEGGEIHMVGAEPSDDQRDEVADLVQRAEAIRSGLVKPDVDNMLAVTTDGRKAALDIRLLHPELGDFPGSKVNLCVRNVLDVYHRTTPDRLTQLIFCDLSTPKANRFNVYDDARAKLLRGLPELGLPGIPAAELAYIHEANSDLKKARLFKDIRDGRVRVLFASTEKAGIGVNIQDRLYAMHELDSPWRPADVEQRSGRILRRGNRNKFVLLYRYVTKETFDAYMWQTLEYKARMIAQVMVGEVTVRRIEDMDATTLSFAQMKALASGNPLVMEKAGVDATVMKLQRAYNAYCDRQIQNRIDLAAVPDRIRRLQRLLEDTRADIQTRQDTTGDNFAITLEGQYYTDRTEAAPALRRVLIEHDHTSLARRVLTVGYFAGFELQISVHKGHQTELLLVGKTEHTNRLWLDDTKSGGNLQSLENLARRLERDAELITEELERKRLQLQELERNAAEIFPHQEALESALRRQRELEHLLSEKPQQDLGCLETVEAAADDEAEDMAEAA